MSSLSQGTNSENMANETLEKGTQDTSGLGTWFDEQTGHLDDKDATFLKHWNNLLTKEEADIFRFRNELWTMLSADREKLGRCFSEMYR
jgi:DNA replication ATP-dependent helicase Dna2